jgi:hypothetical protein
MREMKMAVDGKQVNYDRDPLGFAIDRAVQWVTKEWESGASNERVRASMWAFLYILKQLLEGGAGSRTVVVTKTISVPSASSTSSTSSSLPSVETTAKVQKMERALTVALAMNNTLAWLKSS